VYMDTKSRVISSMTPSYPSAQHMRAQDDIGYFWFLLVVAEEVVVVK
jgi:hypothetical protein